VLKHHALKTQNGHGSKAPYSLEFSPRWWWLSATNYAHFT